MTLAQLLQYLREAILNDRSDRTEGTSDYLWTDETLAIHINEAQRRFASQSLILRDGTTDEVTKITLVEGQTTYPLHESVIAVLSAKREDQQADLNRVGHPVLAAYRAPSDSWVDPATLTALPPGVPLGYSTDEGLIADSDDTFEQINLRVYPAPSADEDGQFIRLRVVRRPIEDLTVNNPSAQPEIPRNHHIEMLDWAAYLCLRIVDDDAGSAKRASDFKTTFEQHVREARTMVMRKLFAPQGWGHGRGGWSWEN